ncbi:hypothetical protein WICPIJ_000092 [Wickerhamomyces pijperi]|uniref:C3H1-type domain-containing protein n=1 Tax=Wickerhamomyces pijperi TaxID=599730 RepID=A0A9P8QHS5_WICPI|nr:hypothetical protein WICPIJ_000092 [Wickerhamomyces pijperi]
MRRMSSASHSTATQNHQHLNDSLHHGSLNINGVEVSKSPPSRNLAHVPCKFFKQGTCQAGSSCPFSHAIDATTDTTPCKYFQKGNCKFGNKCALAHLLPDGTRLNPKSLAQVYQNHNIIQNSNGSRRRSSATNGYGANNNSSGNGSVSGRSGVTGDSNLSNSFQENGGSSYQSNSPIDIKNYTQSTPKPTQIDTSYTSTSPAFYQQNYNLASYSQTQTSPIRQSSFSYQEMAVSPQYANSSSFTNMSSNIWSTTPNTASTAQTSPNINRAQIINSSSSIPTFQFSAGSFKSGAFSMEVLSGSAIYDEDEPHDDEDDDAYGRNGVFEEDYIPSSLSDLLTPQELQRRGSRPSTTFKRPSFGPSGIAAGTVSALETQFDME